MGFFLHRYFHGNKDIVHLNLKNGNVTKDNIAPEFTGRIHITPDQQIREGYGFTLRLTPLGLKDTDLYTCRWSHFNSQKSMPESKSSNGTIFIVRGGESQLFKFHSYKKRRKKRL